MNHADLALRYLEIFFSGQGFDELLEMFAESLQFEGPFYSFDSAQDYVDSLKSDPPIGCEYKLLNICEDAGFVTVIYEFKKDSIQTSMSQLFEIKNGKITKILLIFDTGKFV
jgi:hypothetical protein